MRRRSKMLLAFLTAAIVLGCGGGRLRVLSGFDVVVSMGCGDECPAVPANRRLEWEIPDPKHMPLADFRAVRDQVETEVVRLLSSLEA